MQKDSPSEYDKGYADAILHLYGISNLTSITNQSPKFIKGDKVKTLRGRIATITDLYYDEEDSVWRYSLGNPAQYIPEPRLEPYVEREDKEPMKENELNNRKQLYDALCQLESASVNVRKCLVAAD